MKILDRALNILHYLTKKTVEQFFETKNYKIRS